MAFNNVIIVLPMISVSFSGKVCREACCGGTKKWDVMFCVDLYY